MNDEDDMSAFLARATGPQPFGAGLEPGEQQSLEWLMARVGKCTASRFADVIALKKDGKPKQERENYLWELVVERFTGQPFGHFKSRATDWGLEQEGLARMAYEARKGAIVAQTGFVQHPTIANCGGSPDGLVDDDGGVQIKCPWNSANHLACFLGGMPPEHMAQVQGEMCVTGREYWDFISYDSRMPKPFDLYVQRVPRNYEYTASMEAAIRGFLAEVEDLEARIREQA